MLMLAATFLLSGGTSVHYAAEPDDIHVTTSSRDGGWLGVSVRDMTPKLARSMETTTDRGALVTDVVEDSPAALAGLKENDIITEYDGKKIADADDLRNYVRKTKPDAKVSLVVTRKDERKTLDVTIKERTRTTTMAPLPPPVPSTSFGTVEILGLRLSTLNKQLGEYFNAPEGMGVLVEYVEPDSRGAQGGLKAGDVITKIGSRKVESVRDARRSFDRYDEGEKIDVQIVRKGNPQALTVIAEDQENREHHRFYFRSRPQSFQFDGFDQEGMRELELDLEDLRPDLEELRIELDGLRQNLREELRGLKNNIRINVRSTPGGV